MIKARRILVIGSAGSGKSTTARMIGDALNLPVYHMDREVFWLPGWIERDKADQVKQVDRIVALEEWVFEGNNSRTFPRREARAEMLIWLDVPMGLRMLRVIRRAIQQNGQTRPDMAEDCPERLTMLPEFLLFILRTGRESRRKQAALFEKTALQKHKFRRFKEVNAFVDTLARGQITEFKRKEDTT